VQEANALHGRKLSSAKLRMTAAIAMVVVGSAWFAHSRGGNGSSADAPSAPLPQVGVSNPLMHELDTRLGFLELERNDAGTAQNVEQRTSDQQAAQAAVDDARAQIRDARFDLDHCRITARFTGRIGAHLVSVGNLIAGSRAATSPTTLLATLVSLDPIHLEFV